jgi:hypothetical protein
VTGALAGTASGVGIAFLFATSVWRKPERWRRMVDSALNLAVPLLIVGAFGLLATSGLPIFYGPLVIALLVSAVVVFWTISVTLLALVRGTAWTYSEASELKIVGIVGLLVCITMILAFAGFRFLAESTLGLPQLS